MHDSRRYRDNAAECLLAAQEACELHCRRLHLSIFSNIIAFFIILTTADHAHAGVQRDALNFGFAAPRQLL
jgi:hypothetical protein